MPPRSGKTGFSLIEVNLAIFVVAIGMLTLFSLFPAGLRQVETSHDSTQEALFGDYVLSTLRAEAVMLGSGEWAAAELESVGFDLETHYPQPPAPIKAVVFPAGSEDVMRYILEIGSTNAGRLLTASLWCQVGEFGSTTETNFKWQAKQFYTEFVYSGRP